MNERRREPRGTEDRDGQQWLAVYHAPETSAKVKLRLLGERETALRAWPSEPTLKEQLAWIERERMSVLKDLGSE